MNRTLVAKAITPLLLMTAALGACATGGHPAFEKPGVEAADVQRDQNECLLTAIDNENGLILFAHVDRDAVARCMEARGYTVVSK